MTANKSTANKSSKSNKAQYRSQNQIRWCSGCGDFHILSALTSAWASLELKQENIAVISGIGCSSRLPYYTEVYGFHTIHGRAPTVALGLKLINPDLSVWVVTGDGDGLSIGGNHLIHICRRNPNITILLFNNEIYGLTKGQVSPTSPKGLHTRSTPKGSLDTPINASSLAISSGASFVARVVDTDLAMMREVFQQAHHHQGLSFIEIYTNCVIFNDGAFEDIEKRQKRAQTCITLKDNQPLTFANNKVLHFEGFTPVISTRDSSSHQSWVHRKDIEDPSYAFALANLKPPQHPLALGILRQVQRPTYEQELLQNNHKPSISSAKGLESTFRKGSFQSTTSPTT